MRYDAIRELAKASGSFGPEPAGTKRRLLREIESRSRHSARGLRVLHDVLCFLRAYPDDARVLRAVESVIAKLPVWLEVAGIDGASSALADTGFPGAVNHGELSLPLLRRMTRRIPGCFEIDWDEVEDDEHLLNALSLLVTSVECQALDDIGLDLTDWFESSRPSGCRTDLEFLLDLFERGTLEPTTRDLVFEDLRLPLRYALSERGAGRAEIVWPVDRVCYQRKALDRKRWPLAATIRRPFARVEGVGPSVGEELIHLAQRNLCARGLEIRTLSYANERDVTILDCGRGLRIALIGVVSRYRDPLESHYSCFVLKNGVPIAYGPSTVSLGCCEMGLNLFPEFRGAEIRFLYPQFMRAIHQVLGARYFFLTPYGMGEENPAAIRTGAFWFYRKLGFLPTNPEVEELAREEEERMRREPGYRSGPRELRRLSHTSAYLDLSEGECRPLDLGKIGLLQSRFLAERFDGDRPRAVQTCVRRLARLLGRKGVSRLPEGERRAWEILAPLLAMIPGLEHWSSSDKRALERILRRKGGVSERDVDRLLCAHGSLCSSLRDLPRDP